MRTLAALGFAAALAGLTSSHWRRQAQPADLWEADEASAAADGGACASCEWVERPASTRERASE